jgi:tetratricopeptide (TPR) repeat protein
MRIHASLEQIIRETAACGGLTAEAIKLYSDLSVGREDDPNVLLASGKLNVTLRNFPLAIELLSKALALDPGLHEARAFLAVSQLQSGLLESGLETAASLVFTAPDSTFKTRLGAPTCAQTVLGDALFQNNRTSEAISAYERALKVEPQDQHAISRLASLYLTNGQVSEAVGLLDRIKEVNDNRALVSALRLAANDPSKSPSISGMAHALYNLPVV